jgi:putative membrane protein
MTTDGGPREPERPREPINPQVWMAAERTLLAWVRTGLATMGLGFVVARFALFLEELRAPNAALAGTHEISLRLGVAIVVFGVAITLIASILHARELRRQCLGEPFRPSRWSFAITFAVGLGLLGLALAYGLLTSPR